MEQFFGTLLIVSLFFVIFRGIWKPLGYIILIPGSMGLVNKIMTILNFGSNILFVALVFVCVSSIAIAVEYFEEKYNVRLGD